MLCTGSDCIFFQEGARLNGNWRHQRRKTPRYRSPNIVRVDAGCRYCPSCEVWVRGVPTPARWAGHASAGDYCVVRIRPKYEIISGSIVLSSKAPRDKRQNPELKNVVGIIPRGIERAIPQHKGTPNPSRYWHFGCPHVRRDFQLKQGVAPPGAATRPAWAIIRAKRTTPQAATKAANARSEGWNWGLRAEFF